MLNRLIVDGLSLSRGERQLFDALNLTLEAGEAVALTGANGAGKTSFLRAIAGFIRPDQGQIRFEDQQAQAVEPEIVRTRMIHLLGHQEGLKPGRTARQELGFQSGWLGENGDADSAMDKLSLLPLLDLETRKLSAGQKRRLSMARLMTAPRPLWLLDEPLAPLDDLWRARVSTLMQQHLDQGGMILAAVHDPLPCATRSFDLAALS